MSDNTLNTAYALFMAVILLIILMMCSRMTRQTTPKPVPWMGQKMVFTTNEGQTIGHKLP